MSLAVEREVARRILLVVPRHEPLAPVKGIAVELVREHERPPRLHGVELPRAFEDDRRRGVLHDLHRLAQGQRVKRDLCRAGDRAHLKRRRCRTALRERRTRPAPHAHAGVAQARHLEDPPAVRRHAEREVRRQRAHGHAHVPRARAVAHHGAEKVGPCRIAFDLRECRARRRAPALDREAETRACRSPRLASEIVDARACREKRARSGKRLRPRARHRHRERLVPAIDAQGRLREKPGRDDVLHELRRGRAHARGVLEIVRQDLPFRLEDSPQRAQALPGGRDALFRRRRRMIRRHVGEARLRAGVESQLDLERLRLAVEAVMEGKQALVGGPLVREVDRHVWLGLVPSALFGRAHERHPRPSASARREPHGHAVAARARTFGDGHHGRAVISAHVLDAERARSLRVAFHYFRHGFRQVAFPGVERPALRETVLAGFGREIPAYVELGSLYRRADGHDKRENQFSHAVIITHIQFPTKNVMDVFLYSFVESSITVAGSCPSSAARARWRSACRARASSDEVACTIAKRL